MTAPVGRTRIVGLGGAAGDDRVGLVVIEALRRRRVAPSATLHRIADPTGLIPLLDGSGPLVLVDAVLAPPAGRVLDLGVADLAVLPPAATSTHGISAAFACELARQLWPGSQPSVRIVAVTIEPPDGRRTGLSPAVARAVPLAVARVLAAIESSRAGAPSTPPAVR